MHRKDSKMHRFVAQIVEKQEKLIDKIKMDTIRGINDKTDVSSHQTKGGWIKT